MRRIVLGFGVLSALACSDNEKSADVDAGTEIGAAGGTVVSDDGALSLDIPAGALAENVRISITSLGAEGGELGFPDQPTYANYDFEPDGLAFAMPAVVRAVLPGVATTASGNTRVPTVIAMAFNDEVAEINKRQELKIDLDAGSATHVTELSHFSGIGYHAFDAGLDITFEPTPPAVMQLGTNYNVGVRVIGASSFARGFTLLYDDNSVGVIGYGGGALPYALASFEIDSFSTFNDLLPASFYACLQEGTPTYSARLSTEGGIFVTPQVFLEHTCSNGCGGGNGGDAKAIRPGWPVDHLDIDVSVEITRTIDCRPAVIVEPAMGPPYSGLVQYQGWNYPGFSQPGLSAVISAGGTEQSRFDAYVNNIQRFYGIRDDRLANGTCRELRPLGDANPEIFEFEFEGEPVAPSLIDPALIPAPAHIGSGVNDAFVAKFPEELVAPFNPTSAFGTNIYLGLTFELDTPPTITPNGIPVYAPADAPSPLITLPGIVSGTTGVSFQPNDTYVPTAGVIVSWQSDTLDAEFMHVVVYGEGSSGFAAYECFVEPSTQLLTISQDIIDDITAKVWNGSESSAYSIVVEAMAVKRREVAYDGRTLLGFFARAFEMNSFTCGESGSCHD